MIDRAQQDDGADITITKERLAVLLFAAVFLVVVVLVVTPPAEPTVVERNDTAGYVVYDNGEVGVNGSYIVEGQGFVAGTNSFTLSYGGYDVTFDLVGVYDGKQFLGQILNRQMQPLMQITHRLTPNNGVMEAFMVPKLIGNTSDPVLRIDVYVDQEFLDGLNYTRILIGGNQPEFGRIVDFDGIEVADGVFMQRVYDNETDRFASTASVRSGNVFVGEVQREYNPIISSDGTGLFLQ